MSKLGTRLLVHSEFQVYSEFQVCKEVSVTLMDKARQKERTAVTALNKANQYACAINISRYIRITVYM